MGRQTGIKLNGTVDNLIFYEHRGIYSIRTKPSAVKQTKATIRQSKLFGSASHTGAKLRSLLKPGLPDAKNRNMMRRFEQAIAQWLRAKGAESSMLQTNISFITGFNFNEESKLQSRININIEVNINAANNLTVSIPDLIPVRDISAPAHTIMVVMYLQAAVCSIQHDGYNNSAGKILNLLYNNNLIPLQQIEFPVQVNPQILGLVMISFQYIISKPARQSVLKDRRWLPAGVVGAVWGGM